MPQDRESGNKARRWGYENARNVAAHLGATLINPGRSNEAMWNHRRILIKSAHYGDPEIGATPATLDRVDAIVAALQDRDNAYSLYEITPAWFRQHMRQSRSSGASHVMMVRCTDVRGAGRMIGRMTEA
jgi:HD superfamily phosphodiesterase